MALISPTYVLFGQLFVGHNQIALPTICVANPLHYNDAIMSAMASQITSITIVYSTVYSGADQRKHQSSASLAFVREIHRSPVNSPHKGPVTRKMFPFDNVIIRQVFRMCITWDSLSLTFTVPTNILWSGHVAWRSLLTLLSWYPPVLVKSLQSIQRSGTRKFHPRVLIFEWVEVPWFRNRTPG